ncbi:MAG: outer membrane protein assembly factor BamA, partial [Roseovarius sp.]|nr:outer membrane protein assembly factor BamA [Roseovarius sp.]
MKYMRFNPGLMKIAKLAGKAIQGACAILAIMLGLGMVSEGVKAQEYEFSTILVEGNQRIESATIKNYAGIYEGVAVSDGDINDAYQRVLQSGLFESVEIDPQGDVLTIAVVEFPTVNQIVFEGNQRINDSVFERIIESRPKQVFSPSKAERDADLIAEGYLRDGRVSARVTPKVIRRSDNRVDLVFDIFEGKTTEV